MSGRTSGVECGDINLEPPVTLNNVQYVDPNTDQTRFKDIHNLACSKAFVAAGDSGAPVYEPIPNTNDAKAAGIISAGVRDAATLQFLFSCFDTIRNVEGRTGTHVWQF
jgi:hypothetical protein